MEDIDGGEGKRSVPKKKLWRNTTHQNDLGTWKWMILCFVRNNICVVVGKKNGSSLERDRGWFQHPLRYDERAHKTQVSLHTQPTSERKRGGRGPASRPCAIARSSFFRLLFQLTSYIFSDFYLFIWKGNKKVQNTENSKYLIFFSNNHFRIFDAE
jgi:hypothetical protein